MLRQPETKLEWILYTIAGICVVAVLAVIVALTFHFFGL